MKLPLAALAALAALAYGGGGVHAESTTARALADARAIEDGAGARGSIEAQSPEVELKPSSGLRGGRQLGPGELLLDTTKIRRVVDVKVARKFVAKDPKIFSNCGVVSSKSTYWSRDSVNLRVDEKNAVTGDLTQAYVSKYDAVAQDTLYNDYKATTLVQESAPGRGPSNPVAVLASSQDTQLFATIAYPQTASSLYQALSNEPLSITKQVDPIKSSSYISTFVHQMQNCDQVALKGLRKTLISRKKGRFLEEDGAEELAVIMPESFVVDDADNSTTVPLVFTNTGGTALEVDICMYAPEGYELDSVLDEDGTPVEAEESISCVHTLLTAADTTFLFGMSEAPAGGRMLKKDQAQAQAANELSFSIKPNNGNKFNGKIKKNNGKKKN